MKSPKSTFHSSYKWGRALFALLVPLLFASLACVVPFVGGGDQSLKDTQAAMAVQSTFDAERAATLNAQQTEMAGKLPATATPVADSEVGGTLQAQQATLNAQQTQIAEQSTHVVQNTAVPTALEATPTSSSNFVAITDWARLGVVESTKGCYETSLVCWTGVADGYGSDMVLQTKATILVDPQWNKPYLVFWHRYKIGDTLFANVSVQADSQWQTLITYKTGSQQWVQEFLSLEKYKGKKILIKFYAKAGTATALHWNYTKPGSSSEWVIQEVQIFPDFTPPK